VKVRAWSFALLLLLPACAARQLPRSLNQAQEIDASPGTAVAAERAPQALAIARGLLANAAQLHRDGNDEEAAVVAEEAIAAYEEAFVLARAAKAESRRDVAALSLAEEVQQLAELDEAQLRAEREADAFELRARVALDQEGLADVEFLSPERARVRREAAKQLHAEASLLCLAAHLLGSQAQGLSEAEALTSAVEQDLTAGSNERDLYPRAAAVRTSCLKELSLARRPKIQAAPDRAGTDRLLTELSATGKVFAFRDDRGVVINLRAPILASGEVTAEAQAVLDLLAQTSRQNPDYPLLVVGHSAVHAEASKAQVAAEKVAAQLTTLGATGVTTRATGSAQPVVDSRVAGAAAHNARVEVIFIAPAR
jgi:hypothetical protein